jgi:hypothetical protein
VDGKELAEYVARKSPMALELIGKAWRVRKTFDCPAGAPLGCQDFKELVDHSDPEIAEYFYSRDDTQHTYACFRDRESFFVLFYTRYGESGSLGFDEFEKQQSARRELRHIKWFTNPMVGAISVSQFEVKQGAKQESLGSMDDSSLSYQSKFPNKENTITQYSLSIRWSTGRFTESFSGKDRNGQQWDSEETGVCTKLQ